jgi:predicted SAM-dependent methyltransferase
VADKVKLHLGCGKRDFGPGWVNIDSQQLPHIHLHDIKNLPYKEGDVCYIYSSHLIAYFDREEIIPILKEWYRVLKPRGMLRIATPDWDVLRTIPSPMVGPLYGKMNEPPIYHKTVWTFDELKQVLEQIGFYKVSRYDHTKTEHARFDDHSAAYHNGKLISLNIECYA